MSNNSVGFHHARGAPSLVSEPRRPTMDWCHRYTTFDSMASNPIARTSLPTFQPTLSTSTDKGVLQHPPSAAQHRRHWHRRRPPYLRRRPLPGLPHLPLSAPRRPPSTPPPPTKHCPLHSTSTVGASAPTGICASCPHCHIAQPILQHACPHAHRLLLVSSPSQVLIAHPFMTLFAISRFAKKVLVKTPELTALHCELVVSSQITETEFWDGREVRARLTDVRLCLCLTPRPCPSISCSRRPHPTCRRRVNRVTKVECNGNGIRLCPQYV
jgi:hypothetical protein